MRKLHYTTLTELERHASKEAKAAIESLPHHVNLRFEAINPAALALFSPKANVVKTRLILGWSKHARKGVYKHAYAYLCEKDQVRYARLRIGSKHLTVREFDDVEWVKPFDSIYDVYGQTERAGDRISTMAAYYFLTAGHVGEIITSSGRFTKTLLDLCQKIHTPVVTQGKLLEDTESVNDPFRDLLSSSSK